jgi:GNAT superfamily N-acetyltransferase
MSRTLELSEVAFRPYRPYSYPDYKGYKKALRKANLFDRRRDTFEMYNAMAVARPGSIILAEYDNKIIGGVKTDQPHPNIGGLAVRRKYRGQGVGSELVGAAANQLGGEGHKFVEVTIDRKLLKFWFKQGFHVTDKCLLMERDLVPGREDAVSSYLLEAQNRVTTAAFNVIHDTPSLSSNCQTLRVDGILNHLGEPTTPGEVAKVEMIPQVYTDLKQNKTHWGRVVLSNERDRDYRILRTIHKDWPLGYGFYLVQKKGQHDVQCLLSERGIRTLTGVQAASTVQSLIEDATILTKLHAPQTNGRLSLRHELN